MPCDECGAHEFAHPWQAEVGEVRDADRKKRVGEARLEAEWLQQQQPLAGPAHGACQVGEQHERDPAKIRVREVVEEFGKQVALRRRNAVLRAPGEIRRVLVAVHEQQDACADATKDDGLQCVAQGRLHAAGPSRTLQAQVQRHAGLRCHVVGEEGQQQLPAEQRGQGSQHDGTRRDRHA